MFLKKFAALIRTVQAKLPTKHLWSVPANVRKSNIMDSTWMISRMYKPKSHLTWRVVNIRFLRTITYTLLIANVVREGKMKRLSSTMTGVTMKDK